MMLLGDGGNDSFTLSDFQPQKSFRPTTASQLSCGFCTAQKIPAMFGSFANREMDNQLNFNQRRMDKEHWKNALKHLFNDVTHN